MKNTIKMFGIIVLVTVIGFSMAACDGSGSPAGNGGGLVDTTPITINISNIPSDIHAHIFVVGVGLVINNPLMGIMNWNNVGRSLIFEDGETGILYATFIIPHYRIGNYNVRLVEGGTQPFPIAASDDPINITAGTNNFSIIDVSWSNGSLIPGTIIRE